MVRLGSSLALLAACALPLAQAGPISALYSTGDSVVRYGLRNFLRLNETQIDRVLRNENTPIDPHPFARAYESVRSSEAGKRADCPSGRVGDSTCRRFDRRGL